MNNTSWYRVNLNGSFYDDMVGIVIEATFNTKRLAFGETIGSAIFFNENLVIEEV